MSENLTILGAFTIVGFRQHDDGMDVLRFTIPVDPDLMQTLDGLTIEGGVKLGIIVYVEADE